MHLGSVDSTVDGFGILSQKLYGGYVFDRRNQPVEIRGQLNHAFLYEEPCRVVVKKKAYGDVLFAGSVPSSLFISDELLKDFRRAGISGFEAIDADIRLAFPHQPQQARYWQIVVTGWGGIANPRSGVVMLETKKFGAQKYSPCANVRLLLDPDSYDGSDLFMVWPLPYVIWVSPKLASLLAANRAQHYQLDPVRSYRFERLPGNPIGFGPFPLECYLPPDRAAQVGAASGIDWFEYSKNPLRG